MIDLKYFKFNAKYINKIQCNICIFVNISEIMNLRQIELS